jgi:acyl-CoA hydrolase
VEVFIEEMYKDERVKAMEGTFTMVAIDENKQPVKIELLG